MAKYKVAFKSEIYVDEVSNENEATQVAYCKLTMGGEDANIKVTKIELISE